MAVISKGIGLTIYFNGLEYELSNLQEIPELGGDVESVEITTLEDSAHTYTDGIKNYGDTLTFKFLYEKEQFATLREISIENSNTLEEDRACIVVSLPDDTTCSFGGTFSVKLDGIGVNGVLTYTLNIKPNSEMIWG